MPTQGVLRRYTFKLYPNKAQDSALDAARRLHCALYNAALQERIENYREKDHAKSEIVPNGTFINRAGEERIKWKRQHLSDAAHINHKPLTHFDQAKAIKTIRADDPSYEALSADGLSFTLKRLDEAFQAFLRRAKAGAGHEAGFPRFQRSDDYPGFTHRPGRGWNFNFKPGAKSGHTVIKGIPGKIKWRGEFPMFPYGIKTGDVMLRAGVWWLSIVADMPTRMRADANNSGKIEFDLVDSFARVSCADGGHPAGSEETIFIAAKGQIIPFVSGDYRVTPNVSPQTEGNDGRTADTAPQAKPNVSPQTEGNDGKGQRTDRSLSPNVSPQTGGNDGDSACLIATTCPNVSPQTEGNDGCRRFSSSTPPPNVSPQTEGNGGEIPIQQAMAKCKRGSCRYRALRLRKARQDARRARQRREGLHLWTTAMSRQFQTLTIISPPLKADTKSGHGDEYQHGAETALKAALNRRVLDQAPGFAIAMLQYKIAERGGMANVIVAEAPTAIGNEIVEARKATRKARRVAAHA